MVDLFIYSLLLMHFLGIAAWLGGNLFLHLAINPKLSAIPPGASRVLMGGVGRRTTYISWIALATISATGLLLASSEGFLSLPFLNTGTGRVLLLLMVTTLVAIINGAVITFIVYLLMPRTARRLGPAAATSEEIRTMNRTIDFLSLANTALGLVALSLGVLFTNGA